MVSNPAHWMDPSSLQAHAPAGFSPAGSPTLPAHDAGLNECSTILVPYAYLLHSECARVLEGLKLPHLRSLLARLSPTRRVVGDEWHPLMPHERAFSRLMGWSHPDGVCPLAASLAQLDGIDVQNRALALLSPCHWRVGRDQVQLIHPHTLELDETYSRWAFQAIRDLFESEGFECFWGAPSRWYAAHESLGELPTASLERALGQAVEPWLRGDSDRYPALKRLRRLQNEVQMRLYTLEPPSERQSLGLAPINSVWISGCGKAQDCALPPASLGTVLSLKHAALSGNMQAWGQAWQALDETLLKDLLNRARKGEPFSITLCGERHAQTLENRTFSFSSRLTRLRTAWRLPKAQPFLAEL